MKRFISFLMAAVLVLTLAPSQLALEAHAAGTDDRDFITLKKDDSTIAPGITQTIATVRKKYNGQQLVYYTMTVDTKVETAHIYANYKDNDWEAPSNKQYGLQEVTKQMDAAVKNHTVPGTDRYIENYTVVGGINGTGYDMGTGQTRGVLVMEGHVVQEDKINSSGKPEPFFAIMKDGTPKIFWNTDGTDWTNNKDNIQEAIDSFVYPLVKNGEIVCGTQNSPNARTAIGVTADDKVVMLVTDGKQVASEGCDMYELALILKEAGCVDAFNLDGGGSTTYVARPEGESTYRVLSKPCDGSPRSVSASLLVVSTEAPSDVFKRAVLTPEHDFVTPGSTVKVDAVGVSPAGDVVDIPEGYSWQLEDSSLGSVKDGVFTSNGTTGDAVVQIVLDGKAVGETTIHVMQPDSVAFKQTQITVPYGKKADIMINVMSGVHSLTWKPEDFKFTVSDTKLGEVVGSQFAACEYSADAPTGGTITATLVSDPTLTDTSSLVLGRGSEVLEDFDSADALERVVVGPNNYLCNYIMEASLADAETGKVHSGSHSLAITMDLTQMADYGGHQNLQMNYRAGEADVTGLIGIGAWIWVPDEELITSVSQMTWLSYYDGDEHKEYQQYKWEGGENGYSGRSKDENAPYGDGHWYYYYRNLENQKLEYEKTCLNGFYLLFDSQIAQVGFDTKSQNNKLTFYLDDITIDYSSVVDDREPPVFGAVTLHPNAADNNVTMDKNGVTECSASTVSFSAAVSEDTSKSNATGIDPDSAVALIDGVPVEAAWGNGILAVKDVTLAAGDHSLRLRIADNMGNYTSTIRQFRITGDTEAPTVKLVPHDPTADRIPIGSVWYADVVATDASAIDGVELKLDLNNNCTWQLDYADVDPEFEYSCSVYETENVASITLKRKGPAEEDTREGDVILASLPIRTWEMNVPFTYYGMEGVAVAENDADRNDRPLTADVSHMSGTVNSPLRRVTAEFMWSKGYLWASDISVEVDLGEIAYAEGRAPDTLPVFGGKVQVDTELFAKPATVKAAYPEKTRWHAHTPGSPQDKAADCLHTGYTGRVFCTVCNSPVTWGTTVPAAGHKWAIAEGEGNENAGKMCCSVCGKLYSGELDGKTYKDGVMLDGWVEDSYYKEGVKLTGLQELANPDAEGETLWYLFDEKGVCEGKKPYTGEYEGTGYQDGVLHTGWLSNDCYYTDGVKQTEEFYEIDGKMYHFEEGVCKGKLPYTGFRTVEGKRYYYEGGAIYTGTVGDNGWFQVGDETCHACKDKGGALGTVTIGDSRTCIQDGYKFFLCETCNDQKMSEALWAEGHKWKSDTERVCTVCGKQAKDISQASVSFTNSPYFLYTGSAIRPTLNVTDGDNKLIVESDRRGRDGLVTFSNNTQVGLATVSIEGRGDYDEKTTLVGHFTIVPHDVPAIRATGQDKSSVTLEWDKAPGASYYAVYRKGSADKDWTFVKTLNETTLKVEGLELGETYQFRVGSRGSGQDHNGNTIVSANWTYTESVTLAHSWSDYTVVDATCTENGSKTRTCSICGEVETEVLEALGHTVEEWKTSKEPTTTEKGLAVGNCTVCGNEVTKPIPSLDSYPITVAEAENGTVTVDPEEAAAEGEVVTVKAVPAELCKLDKITVETEDGEAVEVKVSEGEDDAYTFTMPKEPVTVTVTFKRVYHEITVTKADNGTVTVSPSGGAYEESEVTVTATPAEGYELVKITVTADGGMVIDVDEDGKFTMPSADVTVSASFSNIPSFTVTLPTGEGYTVAAANGSQSPVREGESYSFTVQVKSGYRRGRDFAVKVNGEKINAENGVYTISNISSDQTVTVDGVELIPANYYSITLPEATPMYSLKATAGSISPVEEGKSYSFKIEIAEGYLDGIGFAVKANGQTLTGRDGIYTISGIKENQTVTVEGVNRKTWTVNKSSGEGYEVQLIGENSQVEHGGSISFVVKLTDRYYTADEEPVKVNGKPLEPDNFGIYTISNITENQSIEVTGVSELEIKAETAPPDVKVDEKIAGSDTGLLESALKDTKTENVQTIAKVSKIAEIVQNVLDALKEPAEKVKDSLKVKVGLDIQPTEYSPKKENNTVASIKLEIKPVYQVVQEVEKKDENGNIVTEEQPVKDGDTKFEGDLETTSFHEAMNITVPLPSSFFGTATSDVIIRHYKDGKEIVEDRQWTTPQPKGGNWEITFKAASFSEYEIVTDTESIAVTFKSEDNEVIEKRVLLSSDVNTGLPEAAKAAETITYTDVETNAIITKTTTYIFEGWKVGGVTSKTLSDSLLNELKSATDKTLVAAFTKSVSTNSENIQETDPEPTKPDKPVTPDTPSSGGGGASSSASVTVSGATGGKVSVDKTSAKAGDRVTVTATPDTGKAVDTVTVTDANGKAVAVTDAGSGKYTFTMPEGEVTVKVTFKDETAAPVDKPSFTDVPAGAYYSDAVAWAVGKDIVNGTGDGCFSPNDNCTRAQIVTMLWRAAGCPEAKADAAFSDVSAGSYYEKAVAWAVANGIVNGTGDGRFSPDDACTRAQAVTMLWRYEKQPVTSGSGFNDVPDGSYYESAVVWAASTGVVNGTGNGRFSPNENCTRAQIVTMLFRDMA